MNECDPNSKKWCFFLKLMVTKKMCATNKNVTKMGMIVEGFYYSVNHSQPIQE
jgi:hypothetical protein